MNPYFYLITRLTRGDGPALAEFSEHIVFPPVVATNGAATVNRAKVYHPSGQFQLTARVVWP